MAKTPQRCNGKIFSLVAGLPLFFSGKTLTFNIFGLSLRHQVASQVTTEDMTWKKSG